MNESEVKKDDKVIETIREVVGMTDDSYDLELIAYANIAGKDLSQNGVIIGQTITAETVWDDMDILDDEHLGAIKAYISMYVKFLIDPPPPSVVRMMKDIIDTTLYRLSVDSELKSIKEKENDKNGTTALRS